MVVANRVPNDCAVRGGHECIDRNIAPSLIRLQRFALNEIDCPLSRETTEPPGLTPEVPRLRLGFLKLPILKLLEASSIESSISLRSGAETRGWSVTLRSPTFVYCAR